MTNFGPIHPRHVIDQVIPDRSDEVAALRAELLAAQVSAAYWRANAAQRALDLGRLVRERDRARDFCIAIAEQRPYWGEGDPAA